MNGAVSGRRPLGLLVLFLLCGGRRVVLGDLVHTLLEFLHARPEGASEIGQSLGAEQDQDDDQDQQQLLISQTEHWRGSFPSLTPLYPTRRSPPCQRAQAQCAPLLILGESR